MFHFLSCVPSVVVEPAVSDKKKSSETWSVSAIPVSTYTRINNVIMSLPILLSYCDIRCWYDKLLVDSSRSDRPLLSCQKRCHQPQYHRLTHSSQREHQWRHFHPAPWCQNPVSADKLKGQLWTPCRSRYQWCCRWRGSWDSGCRKYSWK